MSSDAVFADGSTHSKSRPALSRIVTKSVRCAGRGPLCVITVYCVLAGGSSSSPPAPSPPAPPTPAAPAAPAAAPPDDGSFGGSTAAAPPGTRRTITARASGTASHRKATPRRRSAAPAQLARSEHPLMGSESLCGDNESSCRASRGAMVAVWGAYSRPSAPRPRWMVRA